MSLAERDRNGRWTPGASTHREIPIALLREAFERSGLTPAQVARSLDWYDSRGYLDGHRVKRALGICPTGFGRGYGNKRIRSTTYNRAVKLAEAIGADPVDLGL